MAKAARQAVRLKVTLRDMRPPVWRRLLVPETMTLGDLHAALQGAMGWEGGHLHLFDVGRRQYGDPRMLDDIEDQRRTTVGALAAAGVKRFTYLYDMGDSWEHVVAIEAVEPLEPGRRYPAVIAGKRACPPEDCGGVPGYYDMLEALADPAHPEHAERLEWLGGAFDPEAFSLAEAEARLGVQFRR